MKPYIILPLLLVLQWSFLPANAYNIRVEFKYEDKTYGQSGFTGTQKLPIRYADVVVSGDKSGTIATGTTDINGIFSTNVTDAAFQQTENITIRCYSSAKDYGTYPIAVYNNSSVKAVYSVSTTVNSHAHTEDIDKSGTTAVEAPSTTSGGAFNILDCIIKGYEFVVQLNADLTSLSPFSAFWESGSTATYFTPDYDNTTTGKQPALYLISQASDRDEYDDDIIIHEMGHYIAFAFSADASPGGLHYITDSYDIRLSWSEGWAHYFSSAVRSNPVHVDTFGSASVMTFDISTLSQNGLDISSSATGSDNEIAVANILWSIKLSPPTRIWNIFTSLTEDNMPSLEDFHDLWVAAGYSSIDAVLESNGILFKSDDYEIDNSSTSANEAGVNPSTDTVHTLYPVDDRDWFTFEITSDAEHYLSTYNVKGADTYMLLYDTDGTTLLAQNDDITPAPDSHPHASANRASLITYSFQKTGTYYVRVEALGQDRGAVGEYGSYSFKVSTQHPSDPSATDDSTDTVVSESGGSSGGCFISTLR